LLTVSVIKLVHKRLHCKASSLTLAVAGRMALLAGHAGSRREQAHHTAGYSLAVGSPAVAGRSSPGLAEVGSLVAGSHPVVRSPVVGEGIGLLSC